MQWFGSRAFLLLWLVTSCGGAAKSVHAVPSATADELSGCYAVDEQLGDGLVQMGTQTLVPNAFEQGAVFCVDARGFFVKVASRQTTPRWYRVESDWQVEPILRHREKVGVVWTSQPAVDPDDPCRRGSTDLCCVGGCAVDVPEVAFRFTRVKSSVRVALEDGKSGVSLVRVSESEESAIRREIAGARLIEERGPAALERAIRRADGQRPPAVPGGSTIDLDDAERQPTKKVQRCTNGEELVAEACIAYCPELQPAAGSAFLNINSIPQALVLLDGCLLGQTPLVKRPVTTGAHEVVFVHEERGRIHRRVDVQNGKTLTVAVKFQ